MKKAEGEARDLKIPRIRAESTKKVQHKHTNPVENLIKSYDDALCSLFVSSHFCRRDGLQAPHGLREPTGTISRNITAVVLLNPVQGGQAP